MVNLIVEKAERYAKEIMVSPMRIDHISELSESMISCFFGTVRVFQEKIVLLAWVRRSEWRFLLPVGKVLKE